MTDSKKKKCPALAATVAALCAIGVSRIAAVVKTGCEKMAAVFQKKCN